jgi:hypothetical protein
MFRARAAVAPVDGAPQAVAFARRFLVKVVTGRRGRVDSLPGLPVIPQAKGHETGSQTTQDPPRVQPEGSCVVRYVTPLDVVASPLHVSQETGERGPVDDMRTIVRTFAVPDGGDARDVSGDLNTATVVNAQAGLAPGGLRQVDHQFTPFASQVCRDKPSYLVARAPRPRRARTTGCSRSRIPPC